MTDRQSSLSVRVWLLERGLSQAEIGRQLGISKAAVNRHISGKRNNQKIDAYLLTLGIPEEYLGLPETWDRVKAFEKLEERLNELRAREAA
jgi:transcriptional regulator with XRE-family HTH domain